MFWKRANKGHSAPAHPKYFSRSCVAEAIDKFEFVETISVRRLDDELSEPTIIEFVVEKMFKVRAHIFGLVNADVGCDRILLTSGFANDGSADLTLVNGFNARQPNAYAYLDEVGVVLVCWADVGAFDYAAAEMNLLNAVIWQRRGCREYSILRNHYVKFGSVDNVTIDPSALN